MRRRWWFLGAALAGATCMAVSGAPQTTTAAAGKADDGGTRAPRARHGERARDARPDSYSRERSWFVRVLGDFGERLDRLEEAVDRLAPNDHADAEPAASPEPTGPREFAAVAQSVLEREPRDGAWEELFRTQVASALHQAQLAGASVRSVDCSSSLCRLDVNLPPHAQPISLVQALSSQAAYGGIWASIEPSVTPEGTARLYIAREDHVLPR